MQSYDAIVIGAGVIGSSVAYHLARLGAKNVLVLDRSQIGAGTSTCKNMHSIRCAQTIAPNCPRRIFHARQASHFSIKSCCINMKRVNTSLFSCGYYIDGIK